MNSSNIPARIASFFVFNPSFGQREGEEIEKLLFFYPSDVGPDEKMNTVGLSEAVINFAAQFSKKRSLETMHTEKRIRVFEEVEPNIWFVLDLEKPVTVKESKDGKGPTTFEYDDFAYEDIVLQSVLKQTHKMFRLFNGTITNILERFDVRNLRDKLERFLPKYLSTLDLENADIFTVLDGISFLPLDVRTYLTVQQFLGAAAHSFKNKLFHSVFIFGDNLLWSSLEQEDMRVVYRYLKTSHTQSPTSTQYPNSMDSSSASASNHISNPFSYTRSRSGFVTGPLDLENPDTPVNAPSVYIGSDKALIKLNLIIFQMYRITLLFLISPHCLTDIVFYRQLSSFLSPKCKELDRCIAEAIVRPSPVKEGYRFIYYNAMNLAIKTATKTKASSSLAKEILSLIGRIHSDFERSPESVNEVFVKLQSGGWVVGKKSDQREIYVVVDSKGVKLNEVEEELAKISGTQLNSIFLS